MMRKKPGIYRSIKFVGLLSLLILNACAHKPSGKWVYFRVKIQKGDTINALAARYDTDRMNIVKANPTLIKTGLKVGNWVSVPVYRRGPSRPGLLFDQNIHDNYADQSGEGLLFGPEAEKTGVRLHYPIKGAITSPFGIRNGRPHHGIDIGAPRGTDIAAAASGKVVFSGWQRGYGKTVIISHNSGKYKTLYAHLSKISVKKGNWVALGTKVGDVGATGRATGPHLHFELRDKRDIPVNPINYLPGKPTPDQSLLFGSL